MAEIADATFSQYVFSLLVSDIPSCLIWPFWNSRDFLEIMEMIDKRLNDHGKNWRHVYKVEFP